MSLPFSLNYRDLGGIPTADGKYKVRKRLFARSGKLQHIRTQAILDEGINCIIDLRTPTEIKEKPDVSIPSITYHSLSLLEDATIGITHETGSDPMTFIRKMRKDPDLLRQMMPDIGMLYYEMVTSPHSLNIIEQAIKLFIKNAQNNQFTLFHCTAGKDRTGVLSIILLSILGVSKQDILKDYSRTNRYAFLPSFKKGLIVWLLTGNLHLAKDVYEAFMANKEYAEKVIRIIEETSGTITSFAQNNLHLTSEEITTFRKNALVESDNYK